MNHPFSLKTKQKRNSPASIQRLPGCSNAAYFTAGPVPRQDVFALRRKSLAVLAQRLSTNCPEGWAERAEAPVCGLFLLYFAGCFQDFNKNLSISLYSLRMDKRCTRMYNKARNQRSTAEAQMRANPADLKQKGARPMVDMEPAQQGQAVGIR